MGSRQRIRIPTDALDATPTPRRQIKSTPTLTILDALNDPHLFRPWIKDPATWVGWIAYLSALFGLTMTADQLELYQRCTGRAVPPHTVARESWLIMGRRAGKSFALALIAVFLAAFYDYTPFLSPGERGTVLVIASDRKQARIILRYVRALLNHVPMLKQMVQRETAEGFDLVNSVTIEVATASFRSVRGYTIVAALLDEIAYWPSDDSANPDFEVLNAIRPGMATIPTAMLLCASSPYARRGVLWEAHRKHYGKEGDDVLVWQADTQIMNPTVPASFIAEQYEADPANAAAEYGAQFRTDIEAFIAREAVEACTNVGLHERPPLADIQYSAFVDPSGGSNDAFTLAIGHLSGDKVSVLDAVRERKPPFSPEDVVLEYATLLKSYGINRVVGDRYAGEWPRERFKVHGIDYDPAAKPKSDLYRDLLPLINGRQADLLDHPKLVSQIIGLERRTARSGKDSIDHSPNGHDDVANAVAGCLVNLSANPYSYDTTMAWADYLDDGQGHRAERITRYLMNGGYR